tara:strand:- start:134 stop:748 length:615 start_codon:yes stop_codon:yes gene_type:complete
MTNERLPPKERPHYVNNREFSDAVNEYTIELNEARENDKTLPIVPDYIAQCFLKICEGLSHKPNFIRYTYREEMVMDAVENCLKAIQNYDIDAATRSGRPNAFSYFTQIAWYAFLRRIAKEKKQFDIKVKFMAEASFEDFVDTPDHVDSAHIEMPFVEELRDRIDAIKHNDTLIKEYAKEARKRKKRERRADSDLSDFLGDEVE